MSLPRFSLADKINQHALPALFEGDVDACVSLTDRMFSDVPNTSFHMVRELDFTTCPDTTARLFDTFTLKQEALAPFGSSYTETNGLSFNADQWHFHWFAIRGKPKGRDAEDYFRVCGETVSEDHDAIVLTGMEPLQEIFKNDSDDTNTFARDICECSVVFKFMRLIQSVSRKMEHHRYSLIVSSHDSGVPGNPVPGNPTEFWPRGITMK